MKALALVPALALAAFAFLAPPSAQADDYHGGQRHYYSQGYRHYAPSYGHGHYGAPYYHARRYYAPRYYAPYYYAPYYGYYAPGYYGAYYGAGYGYYAAPPPVRYCPPRAHFGIGIGIHF